MMEYCNLCKCAVTNWGKHVSGSPQSYPIPHEHDRTEREKAIIDYYEKALIAQDAKTLKAVGEWLAGKDQDICDAFSDWYLIAKYEIEILKSGEMPEGEK